jgi:hypothetical protein
VGASRERTMVRSVLTCASSARVCQAISRALLRMK